MMYEVVVTNQAESDLKGIYEYIAFELLSPENAAKQFDRLEAEIIGLEEFPDRFRLYTAEPWHSRGLRVMPVDNYLILYIPSSEKKTVTVIRVVYAGRDVDNQLNNCTDV